MTPEATVILKKNGLKTTQNRLSVFSVFSGSEKAFSLLNLEKILHSKHDLQKFPNLFGERNFREILQRIQHNYLCFKPFKSYYNKIRVCMQQENKLYIS